MGFKNFDKPDNENVENVDKADTKEVSAEEKSSKIKEFFEKFKGNKEGKEDNNEAKEGKEERNIELLGCESACYSPDNNLIALGSTYSGGITLLDAHTLDTVAVYNCDGKVKSCVFSHDSKFLIACDMNKNLYSWDLTYKIPYEKRFTIGNVTKIDVSDEKCLILTDDKKLLEYRTNLYGSYELVASYVIPNNVHDIHNVNDGIMCSHIEMQLVGPNDKVINM